MLLALLARAAALAVLLARLPRAVRAADVQANMGVLAYTLSPSGCASGWTDLSPSSTYNGRLILANTASVGTQGPTPAVQTDTAPTHTHTWSVQATFASAGDLCGESSGNYGVEGTVTVTSSSPGASMTLTPATPFPYITLTLCQCTSCKPFELPNGFVALFASSATSCNSTAGWSPYTAGAGRFLVFNSPTVISSNNSPAPALTAGTGVGTCFLFLAGWCLPF